MDGSTSSRKDAKAGLQIPQAAERSILKLTGE